MGRPKKIVTLIVCVDLGNGTTLVAATMPDGHVEVFVDPDGLTATPTAIGFIAGNPDQPLYGRAALNLRKMEPEHVCVFAKRARGSDIIALIDCNGKSWTPGELEQLLFRWRIRHVEELTGLQVAGVLATVPADFSDAQRRATSAIVEQAGYPCIGIINEPTGAIIGYAKGKTGTYGVLDVGAGTCDVTLVTVKDGTDFTILASSGQDDLGGKEYLAYIIEHCLSLASRQGVVLDPVQDGRDLIGLEYACEAAKVELSSQPSTLISFRAKDRLIDHEMKRETFEELTTPLTQQIVAHMQDALGKANLTPRQLDGVVLVGGGSRVPSVRAAVEALFGTDKVLTNVDPTNAIVTGACHAVGLKIEERRQAGDLNLPGEIPAYVLKGDIQLSDITGQALGVEALNATTREMVLAPIVDQGTPLPASAKKLFGLLNGGAANVSAEIKVLEGKAYCRPDEARVLAEFSLSDLPAGPTKDRIAVLVDIDTNGLITVHAVDTLSSKEISQTVDAGGAVTRSKLG